MAKETVNKETGEVSPKPELNQIIEIITVRPDGTKRIQWDYKYCPTLTEQHASHLTDINWLVKTYTPDALAAYIAARNTRPEITGHDFSMEPDLQGAKNETLRLKKAFEALPESITQQFKNHVEFLKFIDNPANQEKMLELGLLTKKQIQENTVVKPNDEPNNDKKSTDKLKKPPAGENE